MRYEMSSSAAKIRLEENECEGRALLDVEIRRMYGNEEVRSAKE